MSLVFGEFRNLQEIVDFLKDCEQDAVGWDDRKSIPFEIAPRQFLRFAKKAIEEESQEGYVNALSNVKRAIECQLDLLLYVLGQHQKAQRKQWSFPEKIRFIQSVGFVAPEILRKINKARVQLEHEYKYPNPDEVKSALDVAELFLVYTDRFVAKRAIEFVLYTRDNEERINKRLAINFDEDRNLIEIETVDPSSRNLVKHRIDDKNAHYLALLKAYFKLIMEM